MLPDLHLRTSELIKKVGEGQSYVIELRGKPIAELRPITGRRSRNRFPVARRSLPFSNLDTGRIREENRS